MIELKKAFLAAGLLTVSFFLWSGGVLAQEGPADESVAPQPEPSPIPVAITIAGGASMGAYEAGFLYVITETFKTHPGFFDLRLISGASAGTINAILTTIAMGQGPSSADDPSKSPLYTAWTDENMSYQKLFDTQNAQPGSLSSGNSVRETSLGYEKMWVEDLPTPLDLVLGITTTRVNAVNTTLTPGVETLRLEEQFAFRVRSTADDAPVLTNFLFRQPGAPVQGLLPLEVPPKPGITLPAYQFTTMVDFMMASSAFPLAFPPHNLGFCIRSKTPRDPTCAKPNTQVLLRDGGVVDNFPLQLAYRIAQAGVPRRGASSDGSSKHVSDEMMFIYLNPFNAPYQCSDDKKNDESKEYSLFKELGSVVIDFVGFSQSSDIVNLVSDHPEILGQLAVTARSHPDASGSLENFFGFMEADFRKFDFYLGMYDARGFLKNNDRIAAAEGTTRHAFGKALRNLTQPTGKPESEGWKHYRCLEAVFDGEEDTSICDGAEMRNFRILIDASMRRKTNSAQRDPDTHKCNGKDDFPLFMHLLEKNEFEFRDMGLEPDESHMAMKQMRQIFADHLHLYSENLSGVEGMILETVGKPAINMFEYLPAKTIFYGLLGKGQEIGLSNAFGSSRRFRLNTALVVQGLFTLGWNDPVVSFTTVLGPEFELYGSAKYQWRAGLRVGYQFSTQGGFTEDSCNLARTSLDCSLPIGQVFSALNLFERIRIQAGVEWSPPWFSGVPPTNSHLWNVLVAVGWQWLPRF